MRKPALLVVILSLAVLAGQPAAALSLGGIRNTLVQWVLDKVSIEGVFEIEVAEVIGAEQQGTTLRGVEISDAQGVWFTADELTFDFNRTRLLRGQLFIENLSLEGVEMVRQPVVPVGEEIEVDLEGVEAPPEPDTPFYWPRSPVTTAIERLVLDDVFLHEEVLGQAIRFDATGSFRDRDAIQEAALELRRTDQIEGVIDFDYRRDFDANALALNLQASEAPGGLVSYLAQLPPEVPVRVGLQADGTPEAFDTTFDLALTDYLQAQGTAVIDYAGPLSVDAEFVARPGPLMPAEYAQVLGEEAELVVRASEGPDQTVRIETARIQSPYLTASLDGTYSRATGAVDAEVELVAEPGLALPFEGVEFAGLQFEGNVQGAPGAISADGDLVLEGLSTPQLGLDTATLDIDLAQSGTAEAPVTELSAEGLVQGLRVDQVGPDAIGEARITLATTLQGEELLLEAAVIDSEALNFTASGTANIATFDFAIDYGLAAPALGPIFDAYGIDGTGAIDATGQAVSDAGVTTTTTTARLSDFETDFAAAEELVLETTVVRSTERTTFDLAGTGEALRIDEIGPDVLERADLAVTGEIVDDVLTLKTARLASPVLDAVAEGRVNTVTQAGQVEFSVTANDFAPVADAYGYELKGALAASGTAVLGPEGMSLAADAELTDLAGDIDSERLLLEARIDRKGERTDFSVTAESEALSVELEGQELSGPVDLTVRGAMEGEAVTLETARVVSPVLGATIEGQLNLADFSGAVTYDVDEARLAAIAPLLGVDASGVLAAEGSADLTAGVGAEAAVDGTASVTDLSVYGTFIGDVAATYDLALAEAPRGTLRLEVTESPYAPDAPTVFALEMGGPPADWGLSFDLSAPNYLEADGTATVSWEGPLVVSADASARPGPKLPRKYAQLLGDEAELVVDAREGEDGTLRIDTARLTSPVLNARVSGSYAVDTDAADLELELVAEPGLAALFEGVEFAGLRFDGRVTGEPGSLAADGELVLDGFASEQLAVGAAVLRLDIGQTGTADAPVTDIAVEGTIDGLRVAGVGPEAIGQARIRLDGTLTGLELAIETARVDSELLQLWAEGTADIATMEFDLDYDIAAPAIGPLAEAFGVEATGALTAAGRIVSEDGALTLGTRAELMNLKSPWADAGRLAIRGEVTQEGERTAFDVTGMGTRLRVDQLGPELLGDADFVARGELDGDELTIDELRVASPVIRATADGTLDLATGEGRLAYDVEEVALGAIGPVYDLPVAGTASAEGVLGLAAATGANAPHLVGEATVSGLTYAGTEIGNAVLSHDVVLSDAPHGTLELSLTEGPYAPATVETAFRLDGQLLVLDGLEASGFGVTATGDLTVNTETLTAEGPLRLRATEGPFAPAEAEARVRLQGDRLVLEGLRARAFGLAAAGDATVNLDTLLAEGTLRIDDAELAALVGAPVAGAVQGTLRLEPAGGGQAVALDLRLTGLSAYGVGIGAARVEGRVADALGTPRLDLDVTAQGITSGDLRLEMATLSAAGPLSGIEVALRGAGQMETRPVTVSATARADLAGAEMRATIAQMEIAVGEDRLALMAPLTVVSRGSALVVEDLGLALPDGGRLTGELTWYGGPIAGTILLDAPNLSFLERLFGLPIEAGALRVAADFDTRPGSARANVTLSGRDIVASQIAGAEPVSVEARLDWNGRVLNLDARATGDFEEPLVVEATVPVRPTGGLPALAERGPVSARVSWEGEIGDLWALVPLPGHVLTGDAKIDIGVTGDISSPVFTGGILIADGVYQNLDYGVILTGLSLATTVESTGALGVRLDAVDGTEGSVLIEGRVAFGEQGINLTVETRRAIVVRRDDAIVRVDADLRIYQEPDGRLVVAGTVAILEAEIRLINANPPSIVTLGEVRIKGQPIVDGDQELSLPIALNIDVVAPGRIFVRGRGLNSEWDLDLQVRGIITEPRITGEIAAVRGELDLVGREFELERGRVVFNGGRVIDPRLDVSLVRESEGITGRIIVSGSAFDPELSFTSTPALPEDEVLPQLLFGTSSQALTPAQGIQLALGLATFLNGGGGTLDQFRSALGLDSLDIEEGTEGAALEIGKNVAEDVWVGARQSLEGAGTEIVVEVEVFDNVDAYGAVETDGDTAVGVEWRKDF